ncbi:MAG TPA: hypothetical protein VFR86_20915 [Burkholderiaceae bacterium]|nr:hypothetical protein [Burkholderiaceae bacterium]
MRSYDVFNGDADGICALHQLRLAEPRAATLVTGVKRDIALLERVFVEDDVRLTVLDISLDSNVGALRRLLDDDARVAYFDHHSAAQAFAHPNLELHWDEAPDVCTSMLVDRHLGGRYRVWAVAAAFGDNLSQSAQRLAATLSMSESKTAALSELGELLNYNAYGESIADLHYPPAVLYEQLHAYAEPLDFIAASPVYRRLRAGYAEDCAHMADLAAEHEENCGAVFVLPDAPWARRISGVFANQLVARRESAGRSFAVLTAKGDGSYVVSVRAGQPQERAADLFCRGFATGGGRKAAGGINVLPATHLEVFIGSFFDYFAGGGAPWVSGRIGHAEKAVAS